MKKLLLKKIIVITFIVIMFVFIENIVYGAELVDYSKATVTLSYTNNAHLEPKVTISGISFNENNNYYIQYTNSETAVPTEFDWHEINNGVDDLWIGNYLPLAGDIYVWFSEVDEEGTHEFPTPIKLNRLPQLPLGKRLRVTLWGELSNFTSYELIGNDDRNVKYKIGQVTDKTLLQSIKDNTDGSFEQLLTYAKNASNTNNGSFKLSEIDKIHYNENMVDKAYYFIYLELDTENGKYFPLEDVALYQASLTSDTEVLLYNISDPGFKWDIDDSKDDNVNNEENKNDEEKPNEEKPKEENPNTTVPTQKPTTDTDKEDTTIETGKLPQTGLSETIIISLIVVTIISIIIYKKYNNYKDIK